MANHFVRITVAVLLLLLYPSVSRPQGFSNLVELRIYPVSKQQRFMDYFEEHFLESQEVVGMRIWGQFSDLDSPDHFVWVRGYRTMDERLDGLKRFYMSPLWFESGPEAVSMLTGRAENVRLLEPVSESDAFAADWRRPPLVSEASNRDLGVIVVDVFSASSDPTAVIDQIRSSIVPMYESAGGITVGLFRTSDESNNFPMLPIIENEAVIVLFATFENRAQHQSALESAPSMHRVESFVLGPGLRSRLRHRH